jgi:hypothetical protein
MTVEREAVERRDFAIVESGYEPAAVDAHLRAVASELERLGQSAGGALSVGGSAASQVQSVLDAAQQAAAQIEDDARRQAEQAGAQALADARTQVAAVTAAAQALLERLSQLDSDMSQLVAAATRLTPPSPAAAPAPRATPAPAAPAQAVPRPAQAAPAPAAPDPSAAPAEQEAPAAAPEANGDLDGARLVALNMALSGEPRAATERYLAEHFRLRDHAKLIDEVYAAVEG